MNLRTAVLSTLLLLPGALFAQGVVLVAHPASPAESRYLAFLQQVLDERSLLHAAPSATPSHADGAIIVGTASQMQALLTADQLLTWRAAPQPAGEEGYAVTPVPAAGGGHALVLSARQPLGELFAMGWLLRSADMHDGFMHLPQTKAFATAPDQAVRGYQIGYRFKNNTYDAWTLPQFQRQMLDMAVFGLNTMQVVAPLSDDAPTSPLYPAPAEETVVGLSRLSEQYGLRFDLFYPEMAKDYTDPKQVEAELRQFEALVQKLPRLDSIHVPGGDPGHTAPDVLLPLLEKQTAILHRYHPRATVWLSAQGFTAERYARFYALMQGKPKFIDGIFFGPQSRESIQQQRARVPASYPIEFYPDTAHAMHCQFPVPEWDPVYQLTEGREPINPRPAGFEHIYRHFKPFFTGFMVYSEGVNDDVNKVLWGGWGWDLNRPTHTALQDYARYFFASSDTEAEQVAKAIEGLETNWNGPLLANTGIAGTRGLLNSLHPRLSARNWRWDSLRYRADYDYYLQLRRARELVEEQAALRELMAEQEKPAVRMRNARYALHGNVADSVEQYLHAELGQLARALFHEAGIQLSVKLYGASNWERGANFDRVDTPLNNGTWLEKKLKAAAAENTEQAQAAALRTITHWTNPAPGTLYDDLGNPTAEPHLLRGKGWTNDPELYHSSIDGIADKTLEDGWRLSWLSYAETLYEQPLQMRYEHLDPHVRYRVRMTYAGEDYKLPMELQANGTVLQPSRLRSSNPEQVEYEVPASTLRSGELQLQWTRPYGAGGGGRGGQVAEVWLIPQTTVASQVAP